MSLQEDLARNRRIYARLAGGPDAQEDGGPADTTGLRPGEEGGALSQERFRQLLREGGEMSAPVQAPQEPGAGGQAGRLPAGGEAEPGLRVYSLRGPSGPEPLDGTAPAGRPELRGTADDQGPAPQQEDLLETLVRRLEEQQRRYPQELGE